MTLDDQPLVGAIVTFHNDEEQSQGHTNSQGRYQLVHDLPPGRYDVNISKIEGGADVPTGEGMMGQEQFMVRPDAAPGAAIEPPTQVLPPRYSDPQQSELEATVPEDGTDQANFRLTSD